MFAIMNAHICTLHAFLQTQHEFLQTQHAFLLTQHAFMKTQHESKSESPDLVFCDLVKPQQDCVNLALLEKLKNGRFNTTKYDSHTVVCFSINYVFRKSRFLKTMFFDKLCFSINSVFRYYLHPFCRVLSTSLNLTQAHIIILNQDCTCCLLTTALC